MQRKIHIVLFFIFVLTLFVSVNSYAANADINTVSAITNVVPNSEIEADIPVEFVIPFVLLLLMIATGPIFYPHFWEHHYPKVAIILGVIVTLLYIIVLNDTLSLFHSLKEYISFIALLGSLFVAAGGIFVKVDRKATPFVNILFLLFGSVIANIIGTTGASMLLIRPYIKMNKNRIKPYHMETRLCL